jgi:hypothetical protein
VSNGLSAAWHNQELQDFNGKAGEPGGNRTLNPQIKSPIGQSKTLEIRMILDLRCAERAIAKQIDATPAQPECVCAVMQIAVVGHS